MSAVATDAPTCNCRICGQPLDSYIQKVGIPERPDVVFVTCWQDGCAMNGFTVNMAGYAALDLSKYIGHRPDSSGVLAACTRRMPGEKLFG